MKKNEPRWIPYYPENAPPPGPPEPSADEMLSAMGPARYWGWLTPKNRELVLRVMHHHPELTFAKAIAALVEVGM